VREESDNRIMEPSMRENKHTKVHVALENGTDHGRDCTRQRSIGDKSPYHSLISIGEPGRAAWP